MMSRCPGMIQDSSDAKIFQQKEKPSTALAQVWCLIQGAKRYESYEAFGQRVSVSTFEILCKAFQTDIIRETRFSK